MEATLDLADNVKVERQSAVIPLREYKKFFFEKIRQNPDVIFHNADLYPTAFNTVRTATYVKTSKPLTEERRLIPDDENYWLDRFCFQVVSEWPYGKAIRQHIIDMLLFRGEQVAWRNYEASRDVKGLEPASRKNSTYALQEYFVPVEYLEQFTSKMADILGRHEVNLLNVSIRHAKQDPGTLLAWARTEVFGFVLYYKQGTLDTDRKAVGVWTRELIDAALSLGGTYYLPYQIHATENQFRAAYPDADKFFTLKRRLDPNNKFRNKLWDAYYLPTSIKKSGHERRTLQQTQQNGAPTHTPRTNTVFAIPPPPRLRSASRCTASINLKP